MKRIFCISILIVLSMAMFAESPFVSVSGCQLMRNGKPYYFLGTNLWYAPLLGSEMTCGDRVRLCNELDSLHTMGIDNLRILAGAESGSELAPRYVQPILEERAGELNDSLLAGLDFLLMEMQKRDMLAVIYLTNSWDWSGGWGHYLRECGYGDSPCASGDGWNDYCNYAKNFVTSIMAQQLFLQHCEQIICRVNRYTGRPYKDDPTIMSWQLCNEPRPFAKESYEAFAKMLDEQASFIHKLDPNHLVSTGSEGLIGCGQDERLTEKVFMSNAIDYVNMHLWPANWGWANKSRLFEDLPYTYMKSQEYFDYHFRLCERIRKPLVCEEFGFPRNGNSCNPAVGTEARDGVYTMVFEQLAKSRNAQGVLAGVNFWGWGGEGRPEFTRDLSRDNDRNWYVGDDFLCDPPHEPQGWYSVFDSDTSTIEIIKKYAK